MNIQAHTHKLQVVLKKHQLLTLNEVQPRMAIECKQGVLWVTHAGDPRDYMLAAGRHFIPVGKGQGSVVIEAIDDARFDIEEP